MDIDDRPYALGSAAHGAVEPRPTFGGPSLEAGLRLTEGEPDDRAEQDDLDTWWAEAAGGAHCGPARGGTGGRR